jgi:hypothetical protein
VRVEAEVGVDWDGIGQGREVRRLERGRGWGRVERLGLGRWKIGGDLSILSRGRLVSYWRSKDNQERDVRFFNSFLLLDGSSLGAFIGIGIGILPGTIGGTP